MNYFGRVAVIVFALTLYSSAWAQDGSVFNGQEYKPVPSYAYARVPKGGYSRFYGAARLGAPANEEVRVHFYFWPKIATAVDEHERPIRHYRLDVFVRKLRKGSKFRLSQTVDIPNKMFDDEGSSLQTVRFGVRWLNPKTRQTPMIHLQIYNSGFYGPFGLDIAVVSSGGWKGKPVVQGFAFHGDHYDATSSDFTPLDENGTLKIARIYQANDTPGAINYWRWDGHRFNPEEDNQLTWIDEQRNK